MITYDATYLFYAKVYLARQRNHIVKSKASRARGAEDVVCTETIYKISLCDCDPVVGIRVVRHRVYNRWLRLVAQHKTTRNVEQSVLRSSEYWLFRGSL
jgi:hypothetical protein